MDLSKTYFPSRGIQEVPAPLEFICSACLELESLYMAPLKHITQSPSQLKALALQGPAPAKCFQLPGEQPLKKAGGFFV